MSRFSLAQPSWQLSDVKRLHDSLVKNTCYDNVDACTALTTKKQSLSSNFRDVQLQS